MLSNWQHFCFGNTFVVFSLTLTVALNGSKNLVTLLFCFVYFPPALVFVVIIIICFIFILHILALDKIFLKFARFSYIFLLEFHDYCIVCGFGKSFFIFCFCLLSYNNNKNFQANL